MSRSSYGMGMGGYGVGMGRYGMGMSGYMRRSNIMGIFGNIMSIMMVVAMVVMFISMNSNSVTKSTIERTPIDTGLYYDSDNWVTDAWGWTGSSTKLIKGLKYFQKETGVQVHVEITKSIEPYASVQEYARAVYDTVFSDEYHAVFVWYERDDGTGNGDGKWDAYFDVGSAAKVVLDSEATEILFDYFENGYYGDKSEDEFMADMFTKTADRIMKVTKSPWPIFCIIVALIVLLIVALQVRIRVQKRKAQEREDAERILNANIEHLSADKILGEDQDGG